MPTPFEQLLADPAAPLHWLVVARPRDPGTAAEVVQRWSSHGFTTRPDDEPPNARFARRILEGPFTVESIWDGARIGGLVQADFGTLRLAAGDIGDGTSLDAVAALTWTQAPVDVLLGGAGFGLADHAAVFSGVADAPEGDTAVLDIPLRDGRARLDVPAQDRTFAGTGGIEGPPELAGAIKPLPIGRCFNAPGVYLGQIGGKHAWAVGDGRKIKGVPAARVNGSALALVTGTPEDGEYAADLEDCIVTIGGASAAGAWRFDIEGVVDDDDNLIETAAGIAAWLFGEAAPDVEMAPGTVAALDAATDAPLHAFVAGGGSSPTWNELLSDVMASVLGWYVFRPDGKVHLGRFEAPSITPVATFDKLPVETPPRRLRTAPRVWKVEVGYAANLAPLSDNEISGDVADELRARLAAERGWSVAWEDAAVKTADPEAEHLRIPSRFVLKADADAEAVRRGGLFGPKREVFEVEAGMAPFARALGETVAVRDNRLGLSTGGNAVIVAMRRDGAERQASVTLWR